MVWVIEGSPLPTWAFSNGASTYESSEDDPSKDGTSSSSSILIVPWGHEQTMSLESRKGWVFLLNWRNSQPRPSVSDLPWTIMLSVTINKLMVNGNIPHGVHPSITKVIKSGGGVLNSSSSSSEAYSNSEDTSLLPLPEATTTSSLHRHTFTVKNRHMRWGRSQSKVVSLNMRVLASCDKPARVQTAETDETTRVRERARQRECDQQQTNFFCRDEPSRDNERVRLIHKKPRGGKHWFALCSSQLK